MSSRPILLEFGNNTLVYNKKRKTLLFLCGEDLLSPCEGSSTQPMPLFPGKKKKKKEMSPLKIVKQKVYVTDRRGLDEDWTSLTILIMTEANWFLCVLRQDLETPLTRTQREDFE